MHVFYDTFQPSLLFFFSWEKFTLPAASQINQITAELRTLLVLSQLAGYICRQLDFTDPPPLIKKQQMNPTTWLRTFSDMNRNYSASLILTTKSIHTLTMSLFCREEVERRPPAMSISLVSIVKSRPPTPTPDAAVATLKLAGHIFLGVIGIFGNVSMDDKDEHGC